MLTMDVIKPAHAEWDSPNVFISKKDGPLHVYINYLKLKGVTIWDSYLTLGMDE